MATPEDFKNHHDYPAYNTSRSPALSHAESMEHAFARNWSWPAAGTIRGLPNIPVQAGRVEIVATNRLIVDLFWGCLEDVNGQPFGLWSRDQEIEIQLVQGPAVGKEGYDEAVQTLRGILFEADGVTPKRILLHQHPEINMRTWQLWVESPPSDELWRNVAVLYSNRSPYVNLVNYT